MKIKEVGEGKALPTLHPKGIFFQTFNFTQVALENVGSLHMVPQGLSFET